MINTDRDFHLIRVNQCRSVANFSYVSTKDLKESCFEKGWVVYGIRDPRNEP